jgi:hypothetical protein
MYNHGFQMSGSHLRKAEGQDRCQTRNDGDLPRSDRSLSRKDGGKSGKAIGQSGNQSGKVGVQSKKGRGHGGAL